MTKTKARSLHDELSAEFQAGCRDWNRARAHANLKDSPANRAAIDTARDNIDAVLDLWLEAQ
jgi:hypothetical protein